MNNPGMISESGDILDDLCARADTFYDRGDAFGASGNLSARIGDVVWISPTGSSMKGLSKSGLARVHIDGTVPPDSRPSKEYPFHLAIYRARPELRAVVHLHAPCSTAVSCLADLDDAEPLPPITPYFVMRVAPLGVVGYHRPGSSSLAEDVGQVAAQHDCMLMRNHGMICTGRSVAEASERALELEESCRLFLLLRGHDARRLSEEEILDLRRTFRSGTNSRSSR